MKPVGAAETAGRLYDGFQVFFGRKQALAHFGDTGEDFRKSFWVAALFYPLFLYIVFGIPASDPRVDDIPAVYRLIANTSYYGAAWVYWPLIMAYVSTWLGKPDVWIRYVVTMNWMAATPIAMSFAVTLLLADPNGVVGQGLDWGIRLWGILINGWLLQTFFRTSLPLTILLVLGDQFLSLILSDIRVIVLFSGG